ncbi:MAG: hypothetical protein KAI90_07550, partial [Desulfobulbaceae bacterium]|nr:hypothetical protein [Desulfobulbaceae bacterium]
KVKEEKKRSIEPETAPVSHPLPVKAAVEETTIAQVANETGGARLQAREMLIASLEMADAVLENKSEVEKLIHELKTSFERMDGLGISIRQLLKELQAEKKPESVVLQDEEDDYNVGFSSAAKFRQLVIGETITAVSEENISLISPVAPAKLEDYLKSSNVPLNDFGGFMKKLSTQFKGSLSTVKDRKLKKFSFPLMVPRGLGLLDTPDENAASLVVVSNDQWHGVILCSDVYAEPKTIVRFRKEKNGDISGTGFLDSGDEISFLNVTSILKREGFLLMA